MKKPLLYIALACLLLSMAVLPGCQTLVNAFADQVGRNIADSIFGK